jgi:hypothetical protein
MDNGEQLKTNSFLFTHSQQFNRLEGAHRATKAKSKGKAKSIANFLSSCKSLFPVFVLFLLNPQVGFVKSYRFNIEISITEFFPITEFLEALLIPHPSVGLLLK